MESKGGELMESAESMANQQEADGGRRAAPSESNPTPFKSIRESGKTRLEEEENGCQEDTIRNYKNSRFKFDLSASASPALTASPRRHTHTLQPPDTCTHLHTRTPPGTKLLGGAGRREREWKGKKYAPLWVVFLSFSCPCSTESTNDDGFTIPRKIYSDWAKSWPEIGVLIANGDLPGEATLPSADDPNDGTAFIWTDEYTEIYQDALYVRHKRIREWMSNNRRSALGLTSLESTMTSLLATTVAKGGRGRQLREVYQHMYKDEITAAVEAELKEFKPKPCA
ncbi:hypothetical protein D9619_003867 [Psilocybe cf. subviscida]|uniref:Uncharacterized protein n=1 Tax=Psilocybe cf. subviscida TaxID=2480587 RepID=A0A8H5AVX9_9AGAR|nr:hypothetical protein D9619_003867 [Psilocybe cf. subviscida]